MAIDLPGFSKDEIELTLQDGIVTVKAAKSEENEKKDEKGVVVFRERHSGAMMRSFYVGENVKEEDIKAAFENGVLKLDFPKEEAPALPEKKQIAIE
jgi:HSP20 family molecular chaperone IbpA